MEKGLIAVVTRELAIKAVLHGACRIPEVGQPLSEIKTEDLIWAESKGFVTEKDKMTKLPIWVLSGSGSGDGYGYGSGDGYGYGLLSKKEFIDLVMC